MKEVGIFLSCDYLSRKNTRIICEFRLFSVFLQANNQQHKYNDEDKKEKITEIASDVRKATRERAETELTEEKALKKELDKEARALEKARKEKLADFYYKLSALLFTGSVIACLTTFVKDDSSLRSWQPTLLGLLTSICLAIKANITLKN